MPLRYLVKFGNMIVPIHKKANRSNCNNRGKTFLITAMEILVKLKDNRKKSKKIIKPTIELHQKQTSVWIKTKSTGYKS